MYTRAAAVVYERKKLFFIISPRVRGGSFLRYRCIVGRLGMLRDMKNNGNFRHFSYTFMLSVGISAVVK